VNDELSGEKIQCGTDDIGGERGSIDRKKIWLAVFEDTDRGIGRAKI